MNAKERLLMRPWPTCQPRQSIKENHAWFSSGKDLFEEMEMNVLRGSI
jgi:hypothetical protein